MKAVDFDPSALQSLREEPPPVEPVAAHVAAFHGSIFVKGSRRHALERAVSAIAH